MSQQANRHGPWSWRILTSFVAASTIAFVCGGCGSSEPKLVQVHGAVTVNGSPVRAGVVTFQPVENGTVSNRRPSIGTILSDGTYRLSTFKVADGVAPGEYLVAIDCRTSGVDPSGAAARNDFGVSPKYLSPQTSGLSASVPADADEISLDFTLD